MKMEMTFPIRKLPTSSVEDVPFRLSTRIERVNSSPFPVGTRCKVVAAVVASASAGESTFLLAVRYTG